MKNPKIRRKRITGYKVEMQRTDSKFKRKETKDANKQKEYDIIVLTKEKSKKAIEKFHEEPYQLKYMRTYGANRTKQQSKKNIDEK